VLRKIIASITSETSFANVAEEAELGSKNTAVEYLGIFRDCFLLDEVPFFDVDQRRERIKKNKKFYPADPFLLNLFNVFVSGGDSILPYVQRYSQPPLDSHLAEVLVQSELTKAGHTPYYFRGARDLNFFLPRLDLGIEVKQKARITSQDLRALKPVGRSLLVSKSALEKRDEVWIVPKRLFSFLDLDGL
jgi:predicted AAA+ superfamily ATPase